MAPDNRADVGDKILYKLTATNVGNVTLTGVTVTDPQLGTLVCIPPQPATLQPGAKLVCFGSYTLTQADFNVGAVSNTATGDSDQTPPGETTDIEQLQAPGLALIKQGTLDTAVVAPGTRADAGDKVNYTLTATNTGNVTLTDVTIGDPKLGTLACTPSQPVTLAPGAELVCTGTYTLTQADVNSGHVTNTATVDSGQTPPTTVPSDVTITTVPELTLVKQDALDMAVVAPDSRADAGDRINYTLTATNAGNVTLAGVTITDPRLPADLPARPPSPRRCNPARSWSAPAATRWLRQTSTAASSPASGSPTASRRSRSTRRTARRSRKPRRSRWSSAACST